MKHIREAKLRAYIDNALPAAEREQITAHLNACLSCAQRAIVLREQHERVTSLMNSLEPQHDRPSVSPQVARQRLNSVIYQKKEHEMSKGLFSRRYRLAWVMVALVAVLSVSMLAPPVRALAGNFLALFRVKKIEVVTFDPTLLLGDEQAVENAALELERMMNEQAQIEVKGDPEVVDEASARANLDFPMRLPSALEEAQLLTQPGVRVSMRVDLPSIRALLNELGYQDVTLPNSLDGAEVSIDASAFLLAAYGSCEPNTETWASAQGSSDFDGECTVFVQMPSPDVSAPPELDLDQLGLAYLRLLGMSADQAARFSQRVDWTTTLVVPIPHTDMSYQDVNVDGVQGTLIRPKENRRPTEEYVLLWVKDEIVYGLMGTGINKTALEIANSLE